MFLHNRLPKFIRHCLKRLPPASSVSAQHIGEVGDSIFEVQSDSGEAVYKVYYKSTSTVSAPWCDCADWSRRHLPCKHLLGVTSHCLSTVGLGSAASRIQNVSWKSKEVDSNCVGTSTAKESFIIGIVYLSMCLWLIHWTHSRTDWTKNGAPSVHRELYARLQQVQVQVQVLAACIQPGTRTYHAHSHRLATNCKQQLIICPDCGLRKYSGMLSLFLGPANPKKSSPDEVSSRRNVEKLRV